MALARRRLLALSAAAALGLSSCSAGSPDLFGPGRERTGTSYPDGCVDRDSLDTHRRLGAAHLVYDVSALRSAFAFDAGFYAQLEAWQADWVALSGQPAPTSLWTYGSWTDGSANGCRSWHHQGRAIDISRLIDGRRVIASARYDVWGRYTGARRVFHEQRYWALAASLHDHFAYVLTHHYDAKHANHLHVDNGRSGSGRSVFQTRSTTQVQAVQAICSVVWGVRCEVTGDWDRATRRASRAVLEQLGHSGDLPDGDGWRVFLRGTVPRAVRAASA